MAKAGRHNNNKGGLALLEEAVFLLRHAPAGVLFAYFVGALPFVLGLLYFIADMSRGAYAYRHVTTASLGVAALFVWMKCWQSVFANRLSAHLRRSEPAALTFASGFRLAASQALIHATGLVVLPICLVMTFPFGWAFAFYQNTTVLGLDDAESLRGRIRDSKKQAMLWQRSNHVFIASIALFAFIVFINLAAGIIIVPGLLKSLLGIETLITRMGEYVLNTTFLTTVACLAYLCVDPIIKAVYVLRCFYGASLKSGEDLRVQLARFTKAAGAAGLVLVLAIGILGGAPPVRAVVEAPAKTGEQSVEINDLARQIHSEINKSEYTWRMPREKPPEEYREPGMVSDTLQWIVDSIEDFFQMVGRWIKKLDRWIADMLPGGGGEKDDPVEDNRLMRYLVYLGVVVLACLLGVLVYRSVKARGRRVMAESVDINVQTGAPDLTDEDLGADELPVNEWLALAREMMGKGDHRLALRALYLATLADLSEHNMISLARYKSNMDYRRELERRAGNYPELPELFTVNARMFDRSWYGRYAVLPADIDRFNENQERLMAGVAEFSDGPAAPPDL